jgi:hypothetical protein
MAVLALIAFFFSFLAFNVGGTVPESGTVAPAKRATLSVTAVQPLVVAGSGFIPGERVHVTAQGVGKRTRAGRAGRFTVRFPGVNLCSGGTVVARGSLGSRAALSFAQLTDVQCR